MMAYNMGPGRYQEYLTNGWAWPRETRRHLERYDGFDVVSVRVYILKYTHKDEI